MFEYILGIMSLMKRQKRAEEVVRATIGFAAGESGEAVAYVSLGRGLGLEQTLRLPFRCRVLPSLSGRDVAYAAALAVAGELLQRGIKRVTLALDQEELVEDIRQHRTVPAALAVSYVLLGCALNRFREASLECSPSSTCRDLAARARADISLHVAA
jgi:hypothetical protein